MSQKCLKLMKYMMFIFNLIFWMAGCSIIAIGIYFVVNDLYGNLFSASPSLATGNILIVIGCIIMVFGFIGCMGAIKENRCLLLTFFILLLLILIIEVVLAIVLYVYENQFGEHVKKQLESSFETQRREPAQNKTRELWHEIQSNMQCCGINGTQDWGSQIHDSCCQNKIVHHLAIFQKIGFFGILNTAHIGYLVSNQMDDSYSKAGCYEALKDWFERNFLYVGIVTICISIIEVLGMSFALSIYCHISRNSVSLNK